MPLSERQQILSPLRTGLQRYLALIDAFQEGFPEFGILWLRTDYDADEARHESLLSRLNKDVALGPLHNVLDDKTLYNYGEDWRRIFSVMPERIFCLTNDEMPARLDAARELALRRSQPDPPFNRDAHVSPAGDVIDMHAYREATAHMHADAMLNYVFVADKTALETGDVLIVFFDGCGRTVRWARMPPERGEDIAGSWWEALIYEQPEFNEAHIGADYLPGGVCGP